MAIPLDTRTLNNVVSSTLDAQRSVVQDLFFKSNPLLMRLHARNQVKHEGGDRITATFIYAGLGGGSYGKGDTFDTDFKEFMTQGRFDWKRNYAPLAMDNLDMLKNGGVAKVIDLVQAMTKTAALTLADNLGTQMFSDGTGNNGKDVDGLGNAISLTGSYGGITRGADAVGTAIKAADANTTGGAFSLTMMNNEFGLATVANEMPDLIVTSQAIWNKWWDRTQPQQRFEGKTDTASIGFRRFEFNGADVVVDSHVPAGSVYFLNTKYWEFWVMPGRDFTLRDRFEIYNQDAWVSQMLLYGNLICTGPRFQAVVSNVS